MIYLAERLRALRLARGYTQEEVASALHVTAQSVSKWERGETTPDIALLPALANLFETSIDTLMGMDLISDDRRRREVFTEAHDLLRAGDYAAACALLERQLRTFPNDASLMSELAFGMSFIDGRLPEAIALCEDVLERGAPIKVQHTVRAALCLMHAKAGDTERADALAGFLPHARESREEVRAVLRGDPSQEALDAYLRYLVLGEREA